jgi:GT2 family glycosyltransferase
VAAPASQAPAATADVGCVVIGRNEAPRLRRCLESVLAACHRVVYVDSGSTDDSVPIARSLCVPVLDLDPSLPFSAARARNEGLAQLQQDGAARVAFVQFVDGDCRLEAGWLAAGAEALRRDPGLGVVAGRAREDAPGQSIYKLLCDIELDVPAGESDACGGVAMMRASAVQAVGGYDAALAAGEEPELCLRLRRSGWRIARLPVPMMCHDLALRSFRQWWQRSARSGRAYFESWWKHRRGAEHYRRREVARILLWGGAVPLLTAAAQLLLGPAGLLGAGSYLVPAVRAHRWARRAGHGRRASAVYAGACVLGKLPEFAGVLRSWARLLRQSQAQRVTLGR